MRLGEQVNVLLDFQDTRFDNRPVEWLVRLNQTSYPGYLHRVYLLNVDTALDWSLTACYTRGQASRSVTLVDASWSQLVEMNRYTLTSKYNGYLQEPLFKLDELIASSLLECGRAAH